MSKILEVLNLKIRYREKNNLNTIVNGISFEISEGEILGLVGPSGCGKSSTALSIVGLLPENSESEGSIIYNGQDISRLDVNKMRKIRGKDISFVFQEPQSALNPLIKIGKQISEPLLIHFPDLNKKDIYDKVITSMKNVGLNDAENIYGKYPHQLSGGMCQRAVIAMALVCSPKLIILDEPTTALDVITQKQILELLKNINKTMGTAMLFISHNNAVIDYICERKKTMKDGIFTETEEFDG